MVIKCDIVFDNSYQSNNTFYSGDVVKGTVIIECNTTKKISDIVFRAKGETTCEWSVSDNDDTTTYSGKDEHFRNSVSLLTDSYPKHDGFATFAEGIHEFQFSFELPDNLPTTYEGWNGKVKYGIKVTIERPVKFSIVNRWPFIVTTKFDNKAIALFKTPINHTASENFHTLFMQKGTLTLDVKIPASGYCVGQDIPVECMVKNHSKVTMNAIRMWLEQKMTFSSTSPSSQSRTVKEKISSYEGNGMDKEENKLYTLSMKIPEAAPSYSGVIYSVEYFIKIEALVSGIHSNVKTKIPITIGCLPPFIPPMIRRMSHSGDPSKVFFDKCRRPSSINTADISENLDVLLEKLDIPSTNLDVPYENINFPSENIDSTYENIDFPSEKIDVPSKNIDILSGKIDGVTEKLDVPSEKLYIPAENLHVPSEKLDDQIENIDIPSRKLDVVNENIDIISEKIDVATEKLNVPFEKLDNPIENIDVPSEKHDISLNNIEVSSEKHDIPLNNIEVSSEKLDVTTDKLHVPSLGNT